jgi:DNA replication protein DnaC
MKESLLNMLRKLRLSGLAETLEVRLHEARSNSLAHIEFLELILQDELLVRDQRKIARRVKGASFRDLKTLEDFDWEFNPTIKRSQVYDLATGRFIKDRRDVLFCSPPGTGKSHLVQGIGYHLIKLGYVVLYRSIFDVVRDFLHDEAMDGHDRVVARYLKPDLLIIDDFGMKQLPKRSGEFLFEIVMRRYETRSTIMTTNRPLEDWGKLLGDVATATAILDRFLHHAEIITITGKSYRLQNRDSSNGAKAPTGSKKPEKGSKRAKAPIGSDAEDKEQDPTHP